MTRSASTRPPHAESHPVLEQAKALIKTGASKQAADLLLTHVASIPRQPGAHLLCHAALALRYEDRVSAIACAEAAHERMPDLARPLALMATLYEDARRRKDAMPALLQARQAKASPFELTDIGRQLSRMGDHRNALDAVKEGYRQSGQALGLASYALRVALQCADWDFVEQLTRQLLLAHQQGETEAATETPRTHALWCDDEAINIAVASNFARKAFPSQKPMATQAHADAAGRKLRIGYLSYDYREHATSLLAMGALRHHDRDRFELYGYCTSFDDGSAMRRDILSRFDKVRSLANLKDEAAAKKIFEDRIDVLIDLNGLTEGTRLGILAWKPAPVQISYLGFPGTSGGRFMDYVIADGYTVPEGGESLYPEKLIRLPHTYQVNDYIARYLPPPPRRRPDGLPEGALVLGVFNNINKVSRDVWRAWMKILSSVPEAVLWLLEPGEVARDFLRKEIEACGVEPSRVVFAPKCRQELHLARMRLCDLMLDPWPYGGHTTTSDALFAGVPVVTLEGRNFASRVSGGLLHAAGLQGLVQKDTNAYVQCCVSLLRDPKRLMALKQHLVRQRRQLPVFDAVGRTMYLEAAYTAAHERAVKGLAPDHLWVRPRRAPPQPVTAKP
ncbi:MAG: hypothetical protein ACOYNB_05775 [Aquabacterium sp.]|uniref:O-linked N-acetylglucosamine transferase, SPINDLY family protein n=1 Tax=Aquabacterium sp. TaxID=1872578 RepID=UPI003BB9B0C8